VQWFSVFVDVANSFAVITEFFSGELNNIIDSSSEFYIQTFN